MFHRFIEDSLLPKLIMMRDIFRNLLLSKIKRNLKVLSFINLFMWTIGCR